MAAFAHKSVLLNESVDLLGLRPGGVYVDATLGGGGHSEEILSRDGTVRLVGIDRDGEAIAAARERLARFGGRFTAVRANFADMGETLAALGIDRADGVLFDLGVSSHQLDTAERGFSYRTDAPLDMRMDPDGPVTAADLVNGAPEAELKRILSEYGEEKFAGRVAAAIAARRAEKPVTTTGELAEIVASAIPAGAARKERQHPAKRSFQAIRMAVNGELEAVDAGIRAAADLLAPGGRLCDITFHSGEDRLVKGIFSELASGCICPRDFPVCVCGRKPRIRILTRHPVVSGEDELADNPRAHSAKLRAAEKL